MGQAGGLDNLVNNLVRGAAFGREAQHGHAWVGESGHAAGCLCCADGNLGQLVGVGHGRHGHVAHHEHAVLTILRLLGYQQHGAADAGDAGLALDDLQGRAQRVGGGAQRPADLPVGAFGLDDHASQVERVLHQLACLLDSHAFLLAQFGQQGCILLASGVVVGVDDGGLAYVAEAPFPGQRVNLVGVADEDEVCHFVGQHHVGCLQCALLGCFGEHDALLVALSALDDLFY